LSWSRSTAPSASWASHLTSRGQAVSSDSWTISTRRRFGCPSFPSTSYDVSSRASISRPRTSHHAAGDLDQAGHHHELPARSETYLNLDWKQMGLGGDNSWGALPLPQYRLKAEPMRCRFVLRPLATGESPMKLSKLSLP
jgi:hypothetical protein